jgi:hypothetical protein
MSVHLHIFVDEAGDPTLFGGKRGSGMIVKRKSHEYRSR